MENKILQSLGLTKNECKVYLTLLRMGTASAGKITEWCGIHRRNVYDSIERLMEKGLISFVVINNRKYFSAVEPERFFGIIEEKKAVLDEQKKLLSSLLPQLVRAEEPQKQEVAFYKGRGGMKTVYDDILKTGKDYIGYGPGTQIETVMKSYLIHYVNRRVSLNISARMIYDIGSKDKWFTKKPLVESRYLPEQYSSHAAIRIYGDKVAILLFSVDVPIAVVIDNKSIGDSYRKYFEILWAHAEA